MSSSTHQEPQPTPEHEPPADQIAEETTASEPSATEAEREWWEEPGMPWNSKPTKEDYWCLAWFGFVGIFGLALIPLRAWLLGLDPPILLALTGSRIGAASTGALAAVGEASGWIWYVLIGSLVAIKFDWVYWWAGKLWGRGMLDVQAENSPRMGKNIDRVEGWFHKLGWLAIFLAYLPIPLPIKFVVLVLTGATGMSWQKMLVLDFLAKTAWTLLYFWLGWMIGEPVVFVLEQYAKVANWIAIGLLVVVFIGIFRRQSKNAPTV
ncbi:membrane protein DedA, SNARE-associated domain [Corynebacterium appendicis CIP 107643]|uniref:Membrane protein DedA, SNARE-associated domain n=1 Tax=Corynebacterium appendicis CIP 107643 TaxID=1161099 RepID=A0A1N7IMK6_9CORY|nr:VTT domain-containing protein [Corynebacterium appendicis]WJY60187.1 SNARE associated Golgi protein [Corynebacterium appendicis CIP 107643]SIS38317.1 membrane protein DedA, SNARE-associated domain [Corynebacterium appendicis CIP 107643]